MEGMEEFDRRNVKEGFERFEKAAMRGHEESQWIWNAVQIRPACQANPHPQHYNC